MMKKYKNKNGDNRKSKEIRLCGSSVDTIVYMIRYETMQESIMHNELKQESPADARVTRDSASFQDGRQPPSWILSNRK